MSLLRSCFETNVFGAMELIKRFIPKLVAKGTGKIVFASSDAGLQTPPFGGAYAATKWAIEAVAATLREELAPLGVQVAAIQPGFYLTGFNDTAGDRRPTRLGRPVHLARPGGPAGDDR